MLKLINGWTKESVMAQVKKYNNGTKATSDINPEICVYQNKSGNRCAIGCFIPDGHPALGSKKPANMLIFDYPNLKYYMPFDTEDGLRKFQKAHDRAYAGKVYTSIERFLNEEVE